MTPIKQSIPGFLPSGSRGCFVFRLSPGPCFPKGKKTSGLFFPTSFILSQSLLFSAQSVPPARWAWFPARRPGATVSQNSAAYCRSQSSSSAFSQCRPNRSAHPGSAPFPGAVPAQSGSPLFHQTARHHPIHGISVTTRSRLMAKESFPAVFIVYGKTPKT